MPYHTIDSMNWHPKDDAVIPRQVTIKNCATWTWIRKLNATLVRWFEFLKIIKKKKKDLKKKKKKGMYPLKLKRQVLTAESFNR